ncbi:hypothetical protein [Shewanella sp. 125m-1]
MDKSIHKKWDHIVQSTEDKSIADALYLDSLYVKQAVIKQVIENAKYAGLIPTDTIIESKDYRWVIRVTEHQLLILKLQETAKEKPYSPSSIKCLNKHIQELARKTSKTLADLLINNYPPKP